MLQVCGITRQQAESDVSRSGGGMGLREKSVNCESVSLPAMFEVPRGYAGENTQEVTGDIGTHPNGMAWWWLTGIPLKYWHL